MTQIKKQKLSDVVIEVIKRKIFTGELKEGDKLPNQNEFAKQLGVSRTALREALDSLAKLGIIEQRPKTGTVIKTSYAPLHIDTLLPPFLADRKSTFELMETRLLIEEGAVKIAAQKATDEQIAELERIFYDMTEAFKEGTLKEYAKFDQDFHDCIIQSTQNRITIHIYKSIQEIKEKFYKEVHQNLYTLFIFHEKSIDFHQSHKAIYQAIKNREPETASQEMRSHILTTINALKQYYKHIDKMKDQINAANFNSNKLNPLISKDTGIESS